VPGEEPASPFRDDCGGIVIKTIFDAAVQVTSVYALSAFVAAAVVTIIYLTRTKAKNQRVPAAAWVILGLAIVTPSLGGLVVLFVPDPLYRLRVTVKDSEGQILDNAVVSTVPFGVQKKVGNAWEFEIPRAALSATRAVEVRAQSRDGLMNGTKQLTLGNDSNIDTTVDLQLPRDAHISGIVLDKVGNAIATAKVSVVGFGTEAKPTDAFGSFDLNAHAAKTQPVQLHTEADGFLPDNSTYMAGDRVKVTLNPARTVHPPRRR
jgi:hypothetical protein